jgi:hypothetical protein
VLLVKDISVFLPSTAARTSMKPWHESNLFESAVIQFPLHFNQ